MKPCRSRRLILPQPGSRRKQWLQRSSTWKPSKGFQTFPRWFAAGKAGWLPTRDRRHGNPQRVSKPSRDGSQPAKPAGFPRGIVDMETLKGFPNLPAMVRSRQSRLASHAGSSTWKPSKGFQTFPRWLAAGKAGWLPTRDRRHGNPQRVSKPAMVRSRQSRLASHAGSSTWKPSKGFQTRDGSQPAKPAGFPRGIVDMETLKGFPNPRWFAAGKAGWLPTRDRRHGNPQRVSKPAMVRSRQSRLASHAGSSTWKPSKGF